MQAALDEATRGGAVAEVPVGAVIVRDRAIIAAAHNAPRGGHDPTAHAEVLAIRAAAARLGDERLEGCDLWVTLEPCAMCAGAIQHARIARLYYAAADPKGGAVEHGARVLAHGSHRPQVFAGIGADVAAAMLRDFFQVRR